LKAGIITTDIHLYWKWGLHPSYQLVKKFAEEWKPDFWRDLGDFLDFPYLAKFNKDKVSILNEGCLENDIDLANREIDFWQNIVGEEAEIILGNHDGGRTNTVMETTPFFAQSVNLKRRLHADARGIKVHYPYPHDSYVKLGKLLLTHGWYHNKYHARKHLERYSGNVVYGHVHKEQEEMIDLVAEGKCIKAQSLGCLCAKQPDYMKAPSHWSNGFAVVFLHDNGNFHLHPITIIDNSFVWDRHVWTI